jgi:hypothetical protein
MAHPLVRRSTGRLAGIERMAPYSAGSEANPPAPASAKSMLRCELGNGYIPIFQPAGGCLGEINGSSLVFISGLFANAKKNPQKKIRSPRRG